VAAAKVAAGKPGQTGVVGLNVCVRSTNPLLEMIRHASANEPSPVLDGFFIEAHPTSARPLATKAIVVNQWLLTVTGTTAAVLEQPKRGWP